MFRTRLISGVILVALALLTIISGGLVLFFTVMILALIGAGELYRACGVEKAAFRPEPLAAAGFAGIILSYISLLFKDSRFSLMAVVAALIIILFVYVLMFPRYQSDQVMACFFAAVYVGVMLSCVYLARMLPGGRYHVWLIFLSSWGCDTCAYCVGMLIGRHKMAPVLSPKKSVEGAVGGVAGAVVLGILYAVFTHGPLAGYAVICGAGAVISMIGDLAASAIKRNRNIKDYGKLIPGHGGVLDRFDSVIFTAPVIYFLSMILL